MVVGLELAAQELEVGHRIFQRQAEGEAVKILLEEMLESELLALELALELEPEPGLEVEQVLQ